MRQILLFVLLVGTVSQLDAGEIRYPRVFGFTGRPYGPTQAHYQYQKQYGRPWHGYGGESLQVNHAVTGLYSRPCFGGVGLYNSYGVQTGFAGTVLPGWGSPYGYSSVYAPQSFGYYSVGPTFQFYGGTTVGYPGVLPNWNPPHIPSPAMDRFQQEEMDRWQQPVETTLSNTVKPVIPASTAAARLKSLEAQMDGDKAFRAQDFQRAYSRYKQATLVANDQGTPHFRMGYTLVALRQYHRAIEYIRLGLQRDPSWPSTGQQIRTLYGPDNEIIRTLHLQKLTAWVREDIRDPDRLFLLGIMLHFNGRPEDGSTCFETALRLAGSGDHLKAFLQVDPRVLAKNNAAQPAAAIPQPVPDAVGAAAPAQKKAWEPVVPPPPAPGDAAQPAPARREPFQFRVPPPDAR